MSETLEAMTDQPTPKELREAAPGSVTGPGAPGSAGYGAEALERMFRQIEDTNANTVFGKPEQVAGRTIIPVAAVSFGYGFGREHEGTLGGHPVGDAMGGGGGGHVSPVAVLIVEGDQVRVRPILDASRLAFTAVVLFGIGWILKAFR